MAEVTEINPGKSDETEDSSPEITPAATTSTRKHPGGRPTRGKERPPEVRQPQFFDRIAAVPREDWGTRAFMYVYADEPVCRAKTFGTTRYLLKSSVPIHDLEGLKQDYGSFKGWMSLNLRKTGKDATDEVDRLDFEIYDPKYPPKIPRAAWANDDRNARWIALLPPEAPPASAAASSLLEGARFYKDMREDLKEELGPNEPQQTRTSEVLETMKAAKELFSQPAAAPAAPAQDPLQIAVKLAETMMQMKADNPVIDMYRDELKALRDELKEERAEARKIQPTAAPKGMVEQLKELASISDSLTPLKTLFGFGNGNSTTEPVRAGRTGALDVIQTLGSKFFESDLASGVGQWLGAMAQRSVAVNGAPQTMANPGTQVQPQTDQQSFDAFVRDVLNPALLRQYSQGFTGADFAGWLYDAFPDRLKQLQSFTHPMAPGLKGAAVIIGAYRRTPHIWNPIVAQREGEPSFVQFVNEFCQWKPEDSSDGVIDAEIVPDGDQGEDSPERIS